MSDLSLRSWSRQVCAAALRRFSRTPWRHHSCPSFPLPPTMLTTAEVQLLHWLTSAAYTGRGEIVDAGCFLGGSSVALADGLRCNKRLQPQQKEKRITSYDLFVVDWYTCQYFLPEKREGEDFFDRFSQNIRPYEAYITAIKGDIRSIAWGERPIEILFLDVAKQPDIHDIIVQRLFPHLIPGVSFVVQQDYVHEWLPWIHITMEHFTEYFAPRGYVRDASALYQLSKPLPPDQCANFSVQNIPPDQQLRLMNRAIEKVPLPEKKVVMLAKVRLLYDLGRGQEAHALLDALQREQHEPRVVQAIEAMRGFIAR